MTDLAYKPRLFTLSALLTLSGVLALGGCATTVSPTAMAADPNPLLPSEQYPLQAQTLTRAIHLRVNPNGLSDNQRRALDQVADKANWISGEPVSVEIITASAPSAIAAGRNISGYLRDHDVSADHLSQSTAQSQPADVVTVDMVYYRARSYDCNQAWENLAATASNRPYNNFGCAISANMAAMIADPRDLDSPHAASSTDPSRKSVILDKYRKGDVTSAAEDDQSKGNISTAIQ
ncbi:CpaD family pilus assembly lipoprotein [Asticcacaulis sp. EMRT-3]|uniref:CpaD family pilus assembly protein n=1 Tax=Asticcacaulis sp. EMRT-3 TaxID=3040349 RepID=UPI0024AF88B3|nr:CpaD family pilus assembly lipoprotein [Asticcacaulis sp. EMRT-3]MDI7776019.1 CpaD family pilus assembly lipoprotein [Asticcacaulis sp. EMRT-3]